MLFSLDVVRAHKGDCLILHYGDPNDPRVMIIDGGPSSTYAPHLKPRLKAIKAARGLGNTDRLKISLLMVSHVDDDHIEGILDMTKDLIENDKKFAQILGFWHNSFENIIGHKPDELTAAFSGGVVTASTKGEPLDFILDSAEDGEVVTSTLGVLASIKQGAQLRSDIINKLRVELNVEFDGKLIMAEEGSGPLDMGDDLTFTVVGPLLPELKKLHTKHQAWLRELDDDGLTAEDVLSAYIDKSVPNLSSIVVLAELHGKTIFLTGDARGDKILEGLEFVGLVEPGGSKHVDILKVPHHGSSNNLDDDFFERVTADHYVFSGDGRHGNPERESLEMLHKARGDDEYVVHITYPIDEIDRLRKEDWEIEQKKERRKQLENPAKTVREDWSDAKHSIAAFFDENPKFAEKVRVVGDTEPHVIDLHDAVGF